jgi:hypothetical protein
MRNFYKAGQFAQAKEMHLSFSLLELYRCYQYFNNILPYNHLLCGNIPTRWEHSRIE